MPHPIVVDHATDGSAAALSSGQTATVELDGFQEGDMAFAAVRARDDSNTPNIAAPDGWTLIRSDVAGNNRQSLFHRIMPASPPSSHEFTSSGGSGAGSHSITAGVARITGHSADPIDDHSGNTGGSPVTALGVNASRDNCLLLGVFGAANSTETWDPPPSMSHLWLQTASVSGLLGSRHAVAQQNLADTGFTNARTPDTFTGGSQIGQLVAILSRQVFASARGSGQGAASLDGVQHTSAAVAVQGAGGMEAGGLLRAAGAASTSGVGSADAAALSTATASAQASGDGSTDVLGRVFKIVHEGVGLTPREGPPDTVASVGRVSSNGHTIRVEASADVGRIATAAKVGKVAATAKVGS